MNMSRNEVGLLSSMVRSAICITVLSLKKSLSKVPLQGGTIKESIMKYTICFYRFRLSTLMHSILTEQRTVLFFIGFVSFDNRLILGDENLMSLVIYSNIIVEYCPIISSTF